MKNSKKGRGLGKVNAAEGKAWTHEPEFLFCIVSCLIFSFSVFYLFLNQARGFYRSDLTNHLAVAITTGGYSINNLFLKLSYSAARTVGVAFYLTLVVLATALCVGCWLKFQLDREITGERFPWSKAVLVSCALCLLGGIYIPNVYPYFYLTPDYSGPGSAFSICTQPWQNPTYLLMRLFGIITLMLFFRIHSKYLVDGISPKEWLAFTIALLLTNAAKPSFFIAFAPAMLIVLLYDFLKTHGKSFWSAVIFGFGVLCSMPVLFVQKTMLFDNPNSTAQHGIAFSTAPFEKLVSEGKLQPVLVTGCAFFAFVTIAAFIDGKKDRQILFGWLMLVIALGESLFITETGPRAFAGNFGWGVPFCAYALAIVCFKRAVLLRKQLQKSIYYLLMTPFILMLFTGAAYFAHLLGGGDFIA